MKVTTDDSLRRVDARWLGVPGFTFPWNPTRYSAYGLGAPIFLTLLWLTTRFVDVGFWPLVYVLVATVAVTSKLMHTVDDEMPAASILTLVWAELGTPRTSQHGKPHQCTWDLQAVPIFAAPDQAGATELVHQPPPPPRRQWRFRNGR